MLVGVVLCSGALLFIWIKLYPPLPSDPDLETRFRGCKSELADAVRMASQDQVVGLTLETGEVQFRDGGTYLPADRAIQYKSRLECAGVKRIVHARSGDWVMMVSARGMATAGQYVGLVYCGLASNVMNDSDAGCVPKPLRKVAVVPLTDGWYIYHQG
jgi:hypothetical protein